MLGIVLPAILLPLLATKLGSFVCDNAWRIQTAARYRRHRKHDLRFTPTRLEAEGVPDCDKCKHKTSPRNTLAALRFGSWYEARTKDKGRSEVILFGLRLLQLLLQLPALTAVCLIAMSIPATGILARGLHFADALLICFLPIATLFAAFLIRVAYGDDAATISDLQSLARVTTFNVSEQSLHSRAFTQYNYLATLVVAWILLYASAYEGFYNSTHQWFALNHANNNVIEWIYYSVGLASTSGASAIKATAVITLSVSAVQLVLGPVLLFWTTLVITHETRRS